jgi:uncharacterized coiled-coil protein SlyX
MTPKLLSLAALAALIAAGCEYDPTLAARQKEALEQREHMIAELRTTMDEQGEVIVEQIKMMAEMQQTIDKQRSAMRETSATLQRCSERM